MFGMLQNIRVLTTLVVLGGISFLLCVVNLVFVWIILLFPLEINISWHSSGLFVCFFHLCMNYLFKKERKNSPSSGVCVLYLLIVLFQYADLVFPGFFWHCTFNLKCFLYLLDINVLASLHFFSSFYFL